MVCASRPRIGKDGDIWLLFKLVSCQKGAPVVAAIPNGDECKFHPWIVLRHLVQPPLFNSALQLEHHGAQRCTTVRPGALIASATLLLGRCCFAGVIAAPRTAKKLKTLRII